jgi:hypothetical protein
MAQYPCLLAWKRIRCLLPQSGVIDYGSCDCYNQKEYVSFYGWINGACRGYRLGMGFSVLMEG